MSPRTGLLRRFAPRNDERAGEVTFYDNGLMLLALVERRRNVAATLALIGQPKERAMKRQSRRTLCAAGLITAVLVSGAFAQQQEERLGTLSFPTSCDPKVQAE